MDARAAAGASQRVDAGSNAGQHVDAPASAPSSVASSLPEAVPVIPRVPAAGIARASLAAAVAANNAFAVALVKQLSASADGQNSLLSPLSAELALTMTYAGAQGATRAEMAQALHLGAASDQAIFEGQNALVQALSERAAQSFAHDRRYTHVDPQPLASDYQLQVVSSLWGQQGYQWAPPFVRTLGEQYGARVREQDFARQPEPARSKINAWVSEQTDAKITDLIPAQAIGPATRLVLVNALHLKLPWATAFVPSDTAPAPFTRSDKTVVSRSFMHQKSQLGYVDDGRAQIVALPLAGAQLSVLIALPHVGTSLLSYERSLRAGSAALKELPSTALVDLALPRLTFTSETFSMGEVLRELGMKRAFTEDAEFGGFCLPPNDKDLSVSDVLQKTFIAMHEPGVEAAAATAVIMAEVSINEDARPPQRVTMTVNRPYLVAIVDVPTGAILMLGHVADPGEASAP